MFAWQYLFVYIITILFLSSHQRFIECLQRFIDRVVSYSAMQLRFAANAAFPLLPQLNLRLWLNAMRLRIVTQKKKHIPRQLDVFLSLRRYNISEFTCIISRFPQWENQQCFDSLQQICDTIWKYFSLWYPSAISLHGCGRVGYPGWVCFLFWWAYRFPTRKGRPQRGSWPDLPVSYRQK